MATHDMPERRRCIWDDLILDLGKHKDHAQTVLKHTAYYYSTTQTDLLRALMHGMRVPLITGAALQVDRYADGSHHLLVKSQGWDGADVEFYRPDYKPRFRVIINGKVIVPDCWAWGPTWAFVTRALESIPTRDCTIIVQDQRMRGYKVKCQAIGLVQWRIRVSSRYYHTTY